MGVDFTDRSGVGNGHGQQDRSDFDEAGDGAGFKRPALAGKRLGFRGGVPVAKKAGDRRLDRTAFRPGMRLGMPVPMYARVAPFVTRPKGDSGGAVGGLTIRF